MACSPPTAPHFRRTLMSIWQTARFVRKGNYLHGSFIKLPDVDGYINSLNPGDHRDTLGKFPFSEIGVDIAVAAARESLPGWSRLGIDARKAALLRYKTQLETSFESLTTYMTRETGRPLWETRSEVSLTIRLIDLTLDQGAPQLEPWQLQEIDGGCDYHPRGVIGLLGSFSMPIFGPSAHLIPALLAGNTVVFKPSKYTPAVGQLLAEMMDRARLPRGVFNMVQGNGATVGKRLVLHPDVDSIHLEGSVETGIELKQLTLEQPWKRLVLNTCGRGSAIVLDDADLDKTTHELIAGAFLSTGQRRSSTARVIVTRPIAEKVAARMKQVLRGVTIGYGLHREVFCGPLISEKFRKVFLAWQEAIAAEGHEILVKAERLDPDPNGFYVTPSVVRINPNVKREAPSSEQVVGPALEIFVADDLRHAVALHNQSRLGLVTSIFTRRTELAAEIRHQLRVGAVNVNRSTLILSGKLPLEGQNASGNGFPGGIFSVRTVSYPQAWLEEYRPFERQNIMPGLTWPEFGVDDDSPTRILKPAPEEEDMGEMTISDLLIPQDEEVTPIMPVPAAASQPPTALHEPPLRQAAGGERSATAPSTGLGSNTPANGAPVGNAPSNATAPAAGSGTGKKSDSHKGDGAKAESGKSGKIPGKLAEGATAAPAPAAPVSPRATPAAVPPPVSEDEELLEETMEMLPPLPPLPSLLEFDTPDLDGHGSAAETTLSSSATVSMSLENLAARGAHSGDGGVNPQQPKVVINGGPSRQPVIDEDEVTPPMGITPVRE